MARDVVIHEDEVVAAQVLDVLQRAGLQVVDADDAVAVASERIAEMRPEKARASGDDGGRHLGRCYPGLRRPAPGFTKDLRPRAALLASSRDALVGTPGAARRDPGRDPARRLRRRRLGAPGDAGLHALGPGRRPQRRCDRLLRRDARVHGRLGADAARRARARRRSLALAAAVALVLLWRRRPALAAVARRRPRSARSGSSSPSTCTG